MDKCLISEAEWEIMKILWQEPGSTLYQIREKLVHTNWSPSTIKTFLSRLVKKKYVTADHDNPGSFRYTAAVSERECKTSEIDSFLNRVFNGSASQLVSALVQSSLLSEKEQQEILDMIRKHEGD